MHRVKKFLSQESFIAMPDPFTIPNYKVGCLARSVKAKLEKFPVKNLSGMQDIHRHRNKRGPLQPK